LSVPQVNHAANRRSGIYTVISYTISSGTRTRGSLRGGAQWEICGRVGG